MKFKTGDKVKFLNDVGGGVITKLLKNDTASVLCYDGFEVPALTSELMLDNEKISYDQKFTSETKGKIEIPIINAKPDIVKQPLYTQNPDVNCYIALRPKQISQIGETDLEVLVINDSNYYISYTYAYRINSQYSAVCGELEPNSKTFTILAHTKEEYKDDLHISAQILFFDKKPYNYREPASKQFDLKATKFFKSSSYSENDFLDEKAIILTIIEENALKIAMSKISSEDILKTVTKKESENISLNTAKQARKRITNSIKEVDLHIHELVENEAGMSPKDKLDLQLDIFRKEMKSAISDKVNKIIFIHGVGNGTLKIEIRKELQTKFKNFEFQDASFKEYGYGATMVIISK